jgi:hypothetical protein
LVGRGKVGIHGEGRKIIAQRNGRAHVRGYAIFRVPADWAERRFGFASPTLVRGTIARVRRFCRRDYGSVPLQD